MPFLLPVPAALVVRDAAPQRIALQHLTPDQMILQLRFPNGAEKPGAGPEIPGLESLTADGKVLVVAGSPTAAQEVSRLVKMLDVAPRRVRLRLRVVQIVDIHGKRRPATVTEGTLITNSDRRFQLRTEDNNQAWLIAGDAHLASDGSVCTRVTIERQTISPSFEGSDSVYTSRQRITSTCIGLSGQPTVAAFLNSNGAVLNTTNLKAMDLKWLPLHSYVLEITGKAEGNSR